MAKREQRNIPCVIPCGGSSTRIGGDQNKCQILVGNKPIVGHVVDFWRNQGIEEFIFIVGGESAPGISRYARSALSKAVIIDRGNVTNLTKAIALADGHIKQRFILALGDCVNIGQFVAPWDVDFGIGVCITDEYEFRKSYLVSTIGLRVATLVEKPKREMGLCGMGTYFLHKRIFDYISRLSLPDQATSVDLTGALQLAMGWGEEIAPIYFKGDYMNVTYPIDIETLKEVIK